MSPLLLTTVALAADAGPIGGAAGSLYFTPSDNPLDNATGVVVRLGAKLVPQFDLEIEAGRAEGETRDLRIVYWIANPRLQTVYHLTPNQRADLFLSLGAGLQYVNVLRASEGFAPDANDRALYRNPSQDVIMNAGPGITLHVAGPLHLRTDLRWYGTFGQDGTNTQTDTFQNLEWTLGIDLRAELPADLDEDGFKNRQDGCPEEPEDFDGFEDDDGCPDDDNDGDGVRDVSDECVDDPEDKDRFQDKDGCPEDDNDEDGLKDSKDRCANDAEDFDGFEDKDGCPDADNDRDGFIDTRDRCPDDPEDFDGYADKDGCPEEYDDGDGIPEAQDACPREPETVNGFEDADGCPDELPAEVQRFTGIIRGITFETGKDVIRSSSERTLSESLAVLEQYPDLRMEVQGHTDSVGDDDGNLDLSQRRADAVVRWFVDHGADPARLRAIGYGETLPVADNDSDAGRAENRRVEFRLLHDDE